VVIYSVDDTTTDIPTAKLQLKKAGSTRIRECVWEACLGTVAACSNTIFPFAPEKQQWMTTAGMLAAYCLH